MSTLSATQIERALKYQTKPKAQPASPAYDPARDALIAGMFGRRWDSEEIFPPDAIRVWSALNRPTLGEAPNNLDIELVAQVARHTQSPQLRVKAIEGLKLYCSGRSSGSLKPLVRECLETLGISLTLPQPVKD